MAQRRQADGKKRRQIARSPGSPITSSLDRRAKEQARNPRSGRCHVDVNHTARAGGGQGHSDQFAQVKFRDLLQRGRFEAVRIIIGATTMLVAAPAADAIRRRSMRHAATVFRLPRTQLIR